MKNHLPDFVKKRFKVSLDMQQEQLRLLTHLMKEHLTADANHPPTG